MHTDLILNSVLSLMYGIDVGASRTGLVSRDEWAAQIASLGEPPPAVKRPREPVTAQRIVDAALALVASEGFDALTMRRVAATLEVSPSALYVHVRDRAALDELLIGALCASVVLPVPDGSSWQQQALDVCRQLRDQYLRYPGVARTAFAGAPQSLDTQRIYEGLLGILLVGGASPETAGWAIDAAFLYVGAYSLVAARRGADGTSGDAALATRKELGARLRMLPVDRFPHSVTHAEALTSGEGDERFAFAIRQLLKPLSEGGADDRGR